MIIFQQQNEAVVIAGYTKVVKHMICLETQHLVQHKQLRDNTFHHKYRLKKTMPKHVKHTYRYALHTPH